MKGPGPKRVATIQSGVEPVLPSPPTKLAVTNIEAFSVVLQFTPGFDGNSSITKWTVEVNNLTLFLSSMCRLDDAINLKINYLLMNNILLERIQLNYCVNALIPVFINKCSEFMMWMLQSQKYASLHYYSFITLFKTNF